MKIKVPGLDTQQRFVFKVATEQAIEQLKKNLEAEVIDDLELDESQFENDHLLTEDRWKPPHPAVIEAYIEQFKRHTPFTTDNAVAKWLGIKGTNAGRRLRSYKSGENTPPYGIWRKLLVATGRAPQEIVPVIAFMKGK